MHVGIGPSGLLICHLFASFSFEQHFGFSFSLIVEDEYGELPVGT